jgi:DNA-binding transcriptional regulator YiaG
MWYNAKNSPKRRSAMTFKELRKLSGMTQRKYAEYFGIPRRTVEDWDSGKSKCAEYLIALMEYKLIKENIIEKGEH